MSNYLIAILSGVLSVCAVCQAAYPSNRSTYARDRQGNTAYNDQQNVPYLESDQGITRYSNWDYQQGWRNYRDAYFNGETQQEAYRRSHPHGRGGIGYDSDYDEYMRDNRLSRNQQNNFYPNDQYNTNEFAQNDGNYPYTSRRGNRPQKNYYGNYQGYSRYGRYDSNDPRRNDRGFPATLNPAGSDGYEYDGADRYDVQYNRFNGYNSKGGPYR